MTEPAPSVPDRAAATAEDADLILIYDGECPFCARFAKMLRLNAAAGRVALVNARQDHPSVKRVIAEGYDLDQGMAMIWAGDIYHGEACLNRLALMTTPSGVFNRLTAWLFRSKRLSALAYPVLVRLRNAALALTGRKKLAAAGSD